MPVYEYTCRKCGAEYEEVLSISGRHAPVECPECGTKNIKNELTLRGGTNRPNMRRFTPEKIAHDAQHRPVGEKYMY